MGVREAYCRNASLVRYPCSCQPEHEFQEVLSDDDVNYARTHWPFSFSLLPNQRLATPKSTDNVACSYIDAALARPRVMVVIGPWNSFHNRFRKVAPVGGNLLVLK